MLALEGSCSPTCNSLNGILPKYNLYKHTFFAHTLNCRRERLKSLHLTLPSEDTKSTAVLIRELCEARDGQMLTILTRHEIIESVNELSTLNNV